MNSKTKIVLITTSIIAVLLSSCGPKKPVLGPETVVDNTTQVDAKKPIDIPVYEDHLGNGMKVLVLEDHSAPVVTVQVWYRVGSRNERAGIKGLAHLTEHMMFKGSPNVGPEDHARIIDAVGGQENAFTSEDVTAYHDTVPSDRMELAMELEAERMVNAKMDDSHFYKEREVVKEEIRLGQQNNPIGALLEKFRRIAYTEHPYNWTPGGTLEDLDKITPDDLRTFYKTNYSPNNAVLIVVGDTTASNTMELAKKHFGPIESAPTPPAVTVVEPVQTEYRRHELRHPTQLPIAIGGYKAPEASNEDSKVLEVAATILAGGKSSRMHRTLVREKKLAIFAGGFNWKMKDPGLFLIYAGYMPTVPSDKLEEALIGEVTKLGTDGPTSEELTKAKTQLQAEHTFEMTSLWAVGLGLGDAELVEGDYRKFFGSAEAYDDITADDVKRVVSKYLNKNRLTMAHLLPPKEGEKVRHDEATEIEEAKIETTEWPTAQRFLKLGNSTSEPINLPPITRKTLANGLKLIVVERHEQPVVYFDLIARSGKMIEPKGKAGAADLLAEMLTHGTRTRSAEQIAQEAESLGGRIDAGAGSEGIQVNARFLSRDLEKGLSLFADVTLNPTFPAEEMDKAKQPFLGQVKMTKDAPMSMARQYINYAIFGYDHPRGRPTSQETLISISREDLAKLHKQAFKPHGSILTVVGDVDGDETIKTLEAAFGKWEKTGDTFTPPDNPKPLKGRVVHMVDKSDLTQSTIALGHIGIDRKDPDYVAILLGNYVLGAGGFSSRLMKSIRSKGGKTYGVGSRFQTGLTKGPFFAYTFTRTRETGNTIKMILDEIKKIKKKGITEEELQSAKNNLAGSYVITLQTPSGMADELTTAEFYELDEDWVSMYRAAINAPTLKEVNVALNKHLDLKNIAIIVVGNAEEVTKQLKKFGKPKTSDYLEAVPVEERTKK